MSNSLAYYMLTGAHTVTTGGCSYAPKSSAFEGYIRALCYKFQIP